MCQTTTHRRCVGVCAGGCIPSVAIHHSKPLPQLTYYPGANGTFQIDNKGFTKYDRLFVNGLPSSDKGKLRSYVCAICNIIGRPLGHDADSKYYKKQQAIISNFDGAPDLGLLGNDAYAAIAIRMVAAYQAEEASRAHEHSALTLAVARYAKYFLFGSEVRFRSVGLRPVAYDIVIFPGLTLHTSC